MHYLVLHWIKELERKNVSTPIMYLSDKKKIFIPIYSPVHNGPILFKSSLLEHDKMCQNKMK